MKQQVLFAAVAATLFAAPVHAIKINDHAMVANVANPANVGGDAANVYDTLRTASLASQFDAVGRLGDCTATWLGAEGDYAWVLTAARCVRNTNLVHNADHLVFTNKDGIALAGGAGSTSYIHANRINKPSSVRDVGTDIALVRMKRLPASNTHAPVAPVLYNGTAEANVPVGFVSHGPVVGAGVGMTAAWPTTGERRAWGESVIGGTTEQGHALMSRFTMGSATHWAGVSEGDAGSPWFQQRNGQWQIVGATSGGTMVQSNGVRVSKYARWINDLFPAARLASEAPVGLPSPAPAIEITETNGYVSHPRASNEVFTSNGSPELIAPLDAINVSNETELRRTVTAYLRNTQTGVKMPVVFRASRSNGCGEVAINNAFACGASVPRVSYDPALNRGLPAGTWVGTLNFRLVYWNDSTRSGQIWLDAAIKVAAPPVARFDVETGTNLSETFASNVYFTVPTQAGAAGPTSGHYVKTTTGHSTITVQGRDAITGAARTLKLRAQRNNGCADIAMNNATICNNGAVSHLRVWLDPSDNPGLQPSRYRAQFNVQARGWFERSYSQTFPVDVDVNMLP